MDDNLIKNNSIESNEYENKKSMLFYILIITIPLIIIVLIVLLIIYLNKESEINMIKEYDFYVFQIRNPRIECLRYDKGNSCMKLYDKLPNGILSIHGLWPSILNRPVKSYMYVMCTNKDIKVINDGSELFKNLEVYWINESNIDIWEHEYKKHGYCYNVRMNYNESNYTFYFNDTFNLYKRLEFDKFIVSNFTPDDNGFYNFNYSDLNDVIKKKYGKKGYISCYNYNDTQLLYEIGFALDLSFKFIEHEGSEVTDNRKCNESKIITLINSNFTF